MPRSPAKKLLILKILSIMKRHSDREHPLSQRDISDYLEQEYGILVDRKTIKRQLLDLMDAGYRLEYREKERTNVRGGDEVLLTDWYLNREFTDSELRLLIDGLLSSRHISSDRCRELVEKLSGLSSRFFRSHAEYIQTLPGGIPGSGQLFHTIEVLDEAIRRGLQVSFRYLERGIDKELRPRRDHRGRIREYLINPYRMAVVNGRYYLICNCDQYDGTSSYRLDRIADIRLLKTPAKDPARVRGMEQGLELPRHMAEQLYMFSGESIPVTFRASRLILNDLTDWFQEISLFNETADTVDASVKVNREAMLCWAMQYGRYVEVLSPYDLRKELGQAFGKAAERYRGH